MATRRRGPGWVVRCPNPGATAALGRRIGQAATAGDCLLLFGPVGAGKTVLTGGVLEGLGAPGPHPSPTFTIVRTYVGRLPVAHLDLYRLEGRVDPEEIGLEDILGGEGVTIVEWAEYLRDLAPPDALHIGLARPAADPGVRDVTLTAFGPAARRLLEALGASGKEGGGFR